MPTIDQATMKRRLPKAGANCWLGSKRTTSGSSAERRLVHATLSDVDFQTKVLGAKGLVLVDFGAEWCPPCRAVEQILKDLEKEVGDRVTIYTMDVDQSPETAAQYDVRGLPVVMLFKDGAPVERLFGLRSKQVYLSAVSKSA